MRTPLIRRREAGQSIPLIAFIITTLIGMVGLSVDVGNTYSQQRSTNRATDAAAIAGMRAMIEVGSDDSIQEAIKQSFKSNGIDIVDQGDQFATGNQRDVRAYYLDSKGNPLVSCQIGSCGAVPAGATYIQIKVDGKVDTYFARVIGQNSLPIKAQSFAQRCTPADGVYPIAVSRSDISGGKFIAPTNASEAQYYKFFSDAANVQLTARRIYLRPSNVSGDQPGKFSFLRWQTNTSFNSSAELTKSLTGLGNLKRSFSEVTPWPNPGVPAPAAYPLEPTKLSQGDWVYGNPGWTADSGVRSALQTFVTNRTQIMLPIFKSVAGSGSSLYYQFDRLGKFYVTGFSDGSTGVDGAYLDLVYISDASDVACLPTNMVDVNASGTPTTSTDLAVSGAVFVKPRWTTKTPPTQPIQYVFVFDFSGSMNWNFPGWAGQTGSAYQCEQYVAGAKDAGGNLVPDRTSNCPGTWNNTNERRVMVARNAVSSFVDKMNQYDTARVVGFAMNGANFDNGNDTYNTKQPLATDSNNYFYRGQLYRYTWAYPPENASSFTAAGFVPPGGWLAGDPGWTTDKSVIKKWISVAGPRKDPVEASGGTPGANGVQLARTLLDNAPKLAPNGQTYKKVIIYLTDGVANVFIDGRAPWNKENPQTTFENNTNNVACKDISNGSSVIPNTPRCQVNAPNVTYQTGWNTGIKLPITAMTDQTDTMKSQYRANGTNLMIFTMAIGATTGTGLDAMSSEPSLAYVVNDPNAVTSIFDRINIIAEGTCQANSGAWLAKIAAAARPDAAAFPAPNNIDPANKIYGYVYLYDKSGNPLPADRNKLPISEDDQGNLTWKMPAGKGLTPGQYQLEAFIGYKTEDNVTRSYDWVIDRSQSTGSRTASFEVTQADALGTGVVIPSLYLDLSPDKKLCP